MTPFTTLTAIASPLIRDNIDTDAIIPSREMKSTGKTGLAVGLFAPWRYTDAATRSPNPDFVLNDAKYQNAQVLLSGANFGCGSSREHAVWALAEYGIRCIVAESFAPIFFNNCIRNGVLPVIWPKDAISEIAGKTVTIDLANQSIFNGTHYRLFHIDEESKSMLIDGLDAIDLTLKHKHAIAAWLSADRQQRPWVYLEKHA
jgi:3-isopropylmalate/(R)-2-methylmalate dehydratase small subunit